jgi:multicomponent Na+:H+ antiporter subunit C
VILEPGLYNYWIFVVLMMAGLYAVVSRGHLVKKMIGLSVFQVSVFILFISMGKVEGGTAPIVPDHEEHEQALEPFREPFHELSPADRETWIEGVLRDFPTLTGRHELVEEVALGRYALSRGARLGPLLYSNPLPHVLILTAIVVGVATTAMGLAIVVRINEAYGTVEESEIQIADGEP